MQKQVDTELKVGLFVVVGVGLIMLAILVLGGTQSLFSRKNVYTAHFNNVESLIPGAKVIVGGVPVGIVESIDFNGKERNIVVQFSVEKKSIDWIRQDSTVEIATQGVLGDKYISIVTGSVDQPILPSGSDIPVQPSKDITQFLTKGDQLMLSLNGITSSLNRILLTFEKDHRNDVFFKGMAATAKNLSLATEKLNEGMSELHMKKAIGSLSQVLEKINNGTGTLGALVNDPALYDEIRALIGGANRNRVIRNLVRQTIKDSEDKSKPSSPPKTK
jgi:phospholipid/cholesterol/gamma-HCH transport system substrate-binding protein